MENYEQMEFDCRLDSERTLQENVNVSIEFACKQVKEQGLPEVVSRHEGYGIAAEGYSALQVADKKVNDSMKFFASILSTNDAKGVEAASSLKSAAVSAAIVAVQLAAQADRIMQDLYVRSSEEKSPLEEYADENGTGEFEEADEEDSEEASEDAQEEEPEKKSKGRKK